MKKGFNLMLFLAFVGFLATACGGSSDKKTVTPNDNTDNTGGDNNNPSNGDSDSNKPSYVEIEIDASAGGFGAAASNPKNKFTYLSLKTGAIVELTDEQASSSSDWDVAFKRSVVKLNSGPSGPMSAKAYWVGNNAEAYDENGVAVLSWFKSATKESELPDFEAVAFEDAPAENLYIADKVVKAIVGDGSSNGWWLYNPMTHVVSANVDNYWVLKSSEGNSFAQFRVSNLVTVDDFREITVELNVQAVGETAFSATTVEKVFKIPRVEGGFAYYDFDSQSEVSSDDTKWDFCIGYNATSRSYDIFLNGGISANASGASGSAFGPFTDKSEYPSSSSIGGAPFFTDTTGGIFVEKSWYAYNLEGLNKLWPNYRVYLVKTDTSLFKLQILSYYHKETAESGFYTVRFEEVLEK